MTARLNRVAERINIEAPRMNLDQSVGAVSGLVLRFIRFIHRNAPVLAFPAKAGIHVWHGHRPSPVWQKL